MINLSSKQAPNPSRSRARRSQWVLSVTAVGVVLAAAAALPGVVAAVTHPPAVVAFWLEALVQGAGA
ncbi:MAG TPA: hypothetical protein VFP72_06040 [Kineosporiaceae bacterium]|nr:hypothetical protein [Kineosporiaceae bacterium]